MQRKLQSEREAQEMNSRKVKEKFRSYGNQLADITSRIKPYDVQLQDYVRQKFGSEHGRNPKRIVCDEAGESRDAQETKEGKESSKVAQRRSAQRNAHRKKN